MTEVLRERWGFDGIVVADDFAVRMLHQLHHVAQGPVDASAAALSAGLDVELPTSECFAAGSARPSTAASSRRQRSTRRCFACSA